VKKHWPLLCVGALTVLGGCLRLYGLAHRGVWWDEVSVWFDALSGHRSPQEAPLNTILTRYIMALQRRDDHYALHMPAVLFGTATIPAAYLLGRALAQRAGGLLLALLVTLSPTLLATSQEARPYSLLALLTTLQLGLAVSLRASFRGWWLAALALASAGALATHLVALPFTLALGGVLVLAEGAGIARAGERLRALGRVGAIVLAGGAALTLGLAWTWSRPSFDPVMHGPYSFGALTFVRYVLGKCGPGYVAQQRPWGTPDVIVGLYVLLALIGAATLIVRRRYNALLLVTLPACAILVGLYLRLGEKSNWPWFRYAIPTVTPFLALVAVGLCVRARMALLWLPILLCTHFNPHLGLRAWSADARVRRGLEYRDAANQIAAGPVPFVATIFAPEFSDYGDESDRLTSSYALVRHDDLPAFFAGRDGVLRKIAFSSVIGALPVPIRTDETAVELPTGNYAVFLGWDGARNCWALHPKLRDPDPPEKPGVFMRCVMP
jgi:hypothetical protein